MERVSVLQFVLIASIAVSFHSYSVASKQSSHFELEVPIELQDLEYSADDTYPEDYIEKLIAALSPEKRKYMNSTSEIVISDREGNDSSSGCSLDVIVATPMQLKTTDDFGTEYYVVNTKSTIQKFPVQICKSNNESCTNANLRPDDMGCCVRTEDPVVMWVLSAPVEQFKQRERKENEEDDIIQLPMLLKTKCSCIGHPPDTSESNEGPNCNSRFNFKN